MQTNMEPSAAMEDTTMEDVQVKDKGMSSPVNHLEKPTPDPLPTANNLPKRRKRARKPPPTTHKKLPRLEDHQTLQKRPLLHPAIAPPRTSSSTPKIVYISTRTPFIASIKRVRHLLSKIENRASGSASLKHGDARLFKDLERSIKEGGPRDEEVILKATGKAIETLLRICVWWRGQKGVRVTVRTGSAGAVDDVLGAGGEEEGSRVRRVSCLEVRVGLS